MVQNVVPAIERKDFCKHGSDDFAATVRTGVLKVFPIRSEVSKTIAGNLSLFIDDNGLDWWNVDTPLDSKLDCRIADGSENEV